MAKADRQSDEIMLRVLHLKLTVGMTHAQTADEIAREFGVVIAPMRVADILRLIQPHLKG